jgi:hypothetical protein
VLNFLFLKIFEKMVLMMVFFCFLFCFRYTQIPILVTGWQEDGLWPKGMTAQEKSD